MPINEVTSRLVRNALEPWIAEEVLIRGGCNHYDIMFPLINHFFLFSDRT